MDTTLSIQLNEQTFSVLSTAAAAKGQSPGELAAAVVESIYAGGRLPASTDAHALRMQFEQCFGSVDLGRPIGIVNESIDADLAGEYGTAAGSN